MGGMETWSLKLAERLAAIHPIDVVALRGRANGMPPRALNLLWFPFTVMAHILRRKSAPETILLGDMALWPLAGLAALRSRKAKLLIAAHGTDVAYHRRGGIKGRLYGAYLRLGARLLGAAKVIANSRATAEVARETGWTNSVIVPLATEVCELETATVHNRKILFAGRLVIRKGCRWFVEEVLPLLPEGTILQIAGTGWDESEGAVLDHPQIEYLGCLDQQSLAQAYNQAMCVIIPNIKPENGEYEGFGLVAVEAAAAGGLVLAADHGGLRDAVIAGETGILLPIGDAENWALKISEVSAWEHVRRQQFCRSAQAKVRQYYTWERVARDVLGAIGQSA